MLLLSVLAFLCGIITYLALMEIPPLSNDPDTVFWLLNIDFVVLLALLVVGTRRIVELLSGRKRNLAGSQLHVRLIYTFSLLAAIPAITMTILSAFLFHYGVQNWFSHRVQTAVVGSQAVAEAYLEEHRQVIRADLLAMAGDIERQMPYFAGNDAGLENAIETQSLLRNLSEAIIFDTSGRIVARSGLSFALEFEDIPSYALREADRGDVVVMTGTSEDRVRALIKLANFSDAYLFVGRMVDPQVLSRVSDTKRAAAQYENLQTRYADLQVTVIMIFVVVGLLLVIAAIGLGLILSRQIISPITGLIRTADRVRGGDFTARVNDKIKLEEFAFLARAFNRMTSRIEDQQNELIDANRQLDRRRRFTEMVLEGVSSGVISVDSDYTVHMANNSAFKLLEKNEDALIGERIGDLLPEIGVHIEKAYAEPQNIIQAEIPLNVKGQGRRVFLIRIGVQMIGDQDMGVIITFDDITELQSAQRNAAWSDVARRIAHEIKNPLTPIQLSAERLKRKYLSQITEDADTFSLCTDTIIKHVGDIGHMVNEFSSFARMPEAVLKTGNIQTEINDAVFLQKQAHPDVIFDVITNDLNIKCAFDAHQIRQALTNLLQNAIDSIKENDRKDGQVRILLDAKNDKEMAVIISDNGKGLPDTEGGKSLTEPYVTHKHKGTGLGLAIVKKIMEDHNGRIILSNPAWLKDIKNWKNLGGAHVILLFPISGS